MFFTRKSFWIDTTERVLSTAAQTLLALAAVSATELVSLDWPGILTASALAGAMALAKAFAIGGRFDEDPLPKRGIDG